jgi:hypothetical protein
VLRQQVQRGLRQAGDRLRHDLSVLCAVLLDAASPSVDRPDGAGFSTHGA